MLKFLIVAVFVGFTAAATDTEWAFYKAKYGKVYSRENEGYRRLVYNDNVKKIREHNTLFAAGRKSFYLEDNQFADMTVVEFVKLKNGYRSNRAHRERRLQNQKKTLVFSNVTLPTEVDWVKKGLVTNVKNQGDCGSCWSFSTTGALEGAHAKATGKLVSLSEKNLIDCSGSYGNDGCNGGDQGQAFDYIIDNKGIDTEESYPYLPEKGVCRFDDENIGATMSRYEYLTPHSESVLQQVLAMKGPVAVSIDASHESLMYYRGGIYYEPDCSSTKLDHAVLAVGYGTENGQDYWLVKNSWGPDWGLQGYVKMSRNQNNNCGIATEGCYPIV